MNARNILIAGATGVVGEPLTRLLVRRGYRVFGATRTAQRADGLWEIGAIPVVVDALDAVAVRRATSAIRPDAVIHQLTDLPDGLEPSQMAAAVERNAQIRRTGTANLVAAAAAAGTRRIIAQSIAWVYRPGDGPAAEDRPLDREATGSRAVTIAGVAALEEAVLATQGLSGCVLRYGQFYGPGTGSPDRQGKTMPLHVEAAAWAAVLALETGAAGIFNVAEPGDALVTERARQELGWDASMRLAGTPGP